MKPSSDEVTCTQLFRHHHVRHHVSECGAVCEDRCRHDNRAVGDFDGSLGAIATFHAGLRRR